MATLATRENATRQVPRLPSSQRPDAAVRSLCSRSRSVVSVALRLLAATRSLTRAIHLVLDATSPPKWRIGSTDALPSGPIPHSGLRPGAPHKAKFACASVQDQGFETPPSDPSRRSCTTDGCLRSILESCALSPPCTYLCLPCFPQSGSVLTGITGFRTQLFRKHFRKSLSQRSSCNNINGWSEREGPGRGG